MKKLITKTILKAICLAMLLIVVFPLIQSPTITNEMALMQMQTSDVCFIFWELFDNIRPIVKIVCFIIFCYMTYSIVHDIFQYIYIITKEEKEN